MGVESAVVAVIQDISRRPVTELTETEKGVFKLAIENKVHLATPETLEFLGMESRAIAEETKEVVVEERAQILEEVSDTKRSENKIRTIEVESDRCDRSSVSSEYDRDYYFRQPPEIIKTNQLVREVFDHLEHFRLMHLLGLIEGIAKRKPDYIHRFATALTRNEEQAVDAVRAIATIYPEKICSLFQTG